MMKLDVNFRGGLDERLDLKFNYATLRKFARIAEGSILQNIKKQKQADGSPLKQNSPGWRSHKASLGRPLLSLVNEFHRFVKGNQNSYRHVINTKAQTVGIVPATAELILLMEAVYEKGYVGWYGINKQAQKAIKDVVREWIRTTVSAWLKKNRGKTRRR